MSADESLSDFPRAFTETNSYPWDEAPDALRWQWRRWKGHVLRDIPSAELVRCRRFLEGKDGRSGHYFANYIAAIDEILTERGGVL